MCVCVPVFNQLEIESACCNDSIILRIKVWWLKPHRIFFAHIYAMQTTQNQISPLKIHFYENIYFFPFRHIHSYVYTHCTHIALGNSFKPNNHSQFGFSFIHSFIHSKKTKFHICLGRLQFAIWYMVCTVCVCVIQNRNKRNSLQPNIPNDARHTMKMAIVN